MVHEPDALPMVLAMSDYEDTHHPSTVANVQSEEHIAHMTTFLSHLAFWQDVLEHCRSLDVQQTLVDHFQILFLEQLLYVSLLPLLPARRTDIPAIRHFYSHQMQMVAPLSQYSHILQTC